MLSLERLKYYINARLENLVDIGVYDTQAKDKAEFPYLIFTFSDSFFNVRRRVDRVLELNYWNNTNDDSEILAAANVVRLGKFDIDGITLLVPGLDFSTQNEAEGFYHCYCEKDHELADPETNISRIYQRYILKVD